MMHTDPAWFSSDLLPWRRPSVERGPIEGNHRLTALTGGLVFPLLALVFLTGLFMDAWWHVHYVVGFILIPVVALKLASTGYRALRYYTSEPRYVAAGPPELLPRLLAPFLALSVLTALVTGVLLFVQHSRSGVLGTLHTDAAVCSAVLVGLHILTYSADALVTLRREARARRSRAAVLRMSLLGIALLLGITLGVITYRAGVWPARHHDRHDGLAATSTWTARAVLIHLPEL
jgi:hypothetical protein